MKALLIILVAVVVLASPLALDSASAISMCNLQYYMPDGVRGAMMALCYAELLGPIDHSNPLLGPTGTAGGGEW